MTHPCYLCGRPQKGNYSEGGLLWAICSECMDGEREMDAEREEERRARREAEDRYYDFRYDGFDGEPCEAEVEA